MALLLGNSNLGPLLDLISLRPDHRKTRLTVVIDLSHKRDTVPVSLSSKNFDSEPDFRNPRIGRRRPSSKPDAVDFDSDNNNGYDDDESDDNSTDEREKQMRRRLKEIEEMKELEKQAEELQSRIDAEGDSGEEASEEEKKARVRKELEKLAKEQAERRETAKLMFDLGQKAYGKGMYGRAIEFLEGALTIIPGPTLFGGEIQIWLAMAYEANNRHGDCIALYYRLEKKHPSASIRRQAADLRYILQAPKLKISQDEMVTIPLIGSNYDSYAATWSDKYKDKDKRRSGSTTNQLPSNKDYLADFLVWRTPRDWEKDKAFWVALVLWLTVVGAAFFLPR